MIEKLLSAMEEAVDEIEKHDSREIILFHHNDTDGLSSGSILLSAFTDCGYSVSRYSLEKPYPQVLKRVLDGKNRIFLFSDFAGKIAPMISEINGKRNLVIIIDHHPALEADDETVRNLDGMLYGLKGDRDISASATAYLFAMTLMGRFGLEYGHLSHLGVLGAIGDGFLVDGSLAGINRDLLETARNSGLVRIDKKARGDVYFITLAGKEYPALSICEILDTLGGVAYYSDGTEKGIELCLNGLDEQTELYADSLMELKNKLFAQEISRLKGKIGETEHIQWFDVEERFQPMGVKMIGVFCTIIKDMDFIDGGKYLAGFQRVPDKVPGFGEILFDSSKISMRVSEFLTKKIRNDEIPGLSSLLPEATEVIGGFSDACHSLSAATTIPIGREEQLIEEIEKILSDKEGDNTL